MVKAIVVGINEYPQSPLAGCVNDADDVQRYLMHNRGLARKDILPFHDGRATKTAIVTALRDMIMSSSPGDHLLFHFSGHGTQIASDDPNEPDGLDEVLCPVDFDWNDRSTAFTDNELAAILATVPPGTSLTVVIDACHSGDMPKPLNVERQGMRPRFMRPPQDVAWRLAGRKRVVRPRSLGRANVAVVSACAANETAADTSFNGRPNGAFTYHWLAGLGSTPAAPLDALVKEVASPLAPYSMHPNVDGPAEVRATTFLHAPLPVPGTINAAGPVAVAGRDAAQVLFEQAWASKVLGLDVGVQLRISIASGGFEFLLTANPGIPFSWAFRIDGDAVQQVDLGYGFRLLLSVSGWTVRGGEVGFDLTIRIAPPFFGATTVVQQHLTLPRAVAERSLVAPASPADLLALIQLSQMPPGAGAPAAARPGSRPTSTAGTRPRGAGDPIPGQPIRMNIVGGLFGVREERIIPWTLNDGEVRDHVEVFSNPPGSLNVFFTDWANTSPGSETIGDFKVHIGCVVFGGGELVCRPYFRHETITHPETVRASKKNGHSMNGHSAHRQLAEDPFEMEMPEAGGSIRA